MQEPCPVMKTGLAFFSKVPLPGRTKSRLKGILTETECALVHRACLLDLHQMITRMGEKAFLFYTEGSADEFFLPFPGPIPLGFEELRELSLPGFQLIPQQGTDLGERLFTAAQTVIEKLGRVILLGTDLPDISPREITYCLEKMADHDLVMGPAEDGGYYLLGMKKAHPFLFQDIDWSSQRVGEQTLAKADLHHLTADKLPVKRDIDTWEDLRTFAECEEKENLAHLVSFRLAKYFVQKYF